MDKASLINKPKKMISLKKIEDIMNHNNFKHHKKYNPGQLQIENSDQCHSRVVNFFGDVNTEAFSIKANKKQKVVGVGCANGEVKVYDLYEGKVLTIGNTSRMSGYPCTSFRWKPLQSNDFVVSNCDGTLKWYNKDQQSAYGHYEHNEKAYLCSDYQIKEQWCIFGTDENTIEVFDDSTMKQTHVYEAGGPEELNFNHHTNRVFCVKCLPDEPSVFMSGGWDSTVQIWDIRDKKGSVRKICGPSISSDSLDIKNNVLLVGNYQNNDIVQLYDFKSGALIETLNINEPINSNSYCYSASYSTESKYNLMAVSLSGSNKVKVLKDNKVVCEMKFQAAPLCLDFYQLNGKDFLVVGGIEGTIYCLKLDIIE